MEALIGVYLYVFAGIPVNFNFSTFWRESHVQIFACTAVQVVRTIYIGAWPAYILVSYT